MTIIEGRDWKWGDQNGTEDSIGIVYRVIDGEEVYVSNGSTGVYMKSIEFEQNEKYQINFLKIILNPWFRLLLLVYFRKTLKNLIFYCSLINSRFHFDFLFVYGFPGRKQILNGFSHLET